MESFIHERQAPQRRREALAGGQEVQEESGVFVIVVEFLQFSVYKAFTSELGHDSSQFSK